jgi:hypothetical protein
MEFLRGEELEVEHAELVVGRTDGANGRSKLARLFVRVT